MINDKTTSCIAKQEAQMHCCCRAFLLAWEQSPRTDDRLAHFRSGRGRAWAARRGRRFASSSAMLTARSSSESWAGIWPTPWMNPACRCGGTAPQFMEVVSTSSWPRFCNQALGVSHVHSPSRARVARRLCGLKYGTVAASNACRKTRRNGSAVVQIGGPAPRRSSRRRSRDDSVAGNRDLRARAPQ